jgi:enterobacteria phage integrase
VLHGLRKTAASGLADAGCSAHEIMCVTGHTTTRMVERYTKAADRKKGASADILTLEKERPMNVDWKTLENSWNQN